VPAGSTLEAVGQGFREIRNLPTAYSSAYESR
jgi:hypothetical protein